VLGIYGPWGSGKTSILNLLRQKLDLDTQAIVVGLDPWLHANPSDLALAFFQQLCGKLTSDLRIGGRRERRKLARKIRALGRYVAGASAMAPFPYQAGALVATAGARRVAARLEESATSVAKLRAEVASYLDDLWATHRTRVVYLIDDVDRLTGDEIVALLKLVRHLTSLPNVSYVLAMDDQVVRTQLEKLGHPADFLEKFVQVEVRVPQLGPSDRAGHLREALAEVAVASGYQVQPDGILRNIGSYGFLERIVDAHVKTFRQLNRIASTLRMLLAGAAQETKLHLDDACLVAIVAVVWPDMFRRVQHARDFLVDNKLFEFHLGAEDRQERVGSMIGLVADGSSEVADPLRAEVLKAMFPNMASQGISDHQRRDHRRHNRICSSERFDWYFFSDAPNREVSDLLVEEVLSSLSENVDEEERWPHETLRELVEGWGEKGLESFQIRSLTGSRQCRRKLPREYGDGLPVWPVPWRTTFSSHSPTS